VDLTATSAVAHHSVISLMMISHSKSAIEPHLKMSSRHQGGTIHGTLLESKE
jgi:hypothetical protein